METLTSLWDFFLDKILSLLPLSPFREYISYFEGWEFIGYLNWFFPFRGIFIVLEVWLRAVALYYLYSAGMRWLKLMGQ